MRSFFRRVWNEREREAIYELFPAGGVAHGLHPFRIGGPEEFEAFYDLMWNTFDDIHIRIDKTIAFQDSIAIMATGTMTTKKGEVVTSSGMGFATIRDGQILEAWNCWDFLTMLIGLGELRPDVLFEALSRGD